MQFWHPTGLVVGAGLGRADQPVRDGVAAAGAGVPVLRAGDHGRRASRAAPGHHLLRAGHQHGAVLLSGYGNVPAERTAHLIAMLLGMPVSPGFAGKASSRLDERLQDAGFNEAMQAALAAEPVLGADETPVNVLAQDTDPETGEPQTGSPHVLIIRPPGGKLTWLRAMGSRRHEAITKILAFFTGWIRRAANRVSIGIYTSGVPDAGMRVALSTSCAVTTIITPPLPGYRPRSEMSLSRSATTSCSRLKPRAWISRTASRAVSRSPVDAAGTSAPRSVRSWLRPASIFSAIR